MFKKSYIAIIGKDGDTLGTVIVTGSIFKSPKYFYDKLTEALTGGHIIDFKRIK